MILGQFSGWHCWILTWINRGALCFEVQSYSLVFFQIYLVHEIWKEIVWQYDVILLRIWKWRYYIAETNTAKFSSLMSDRALLASSHEICEIESEFDWAQNLKFYSSWSFCIFADFNLKAKKMLGLISIAYSPLSSCGQGLYLFTIYARGPNSKLTRGGKQQPTPYLIRSCSFNHCK